MSHEVTLPNGQIGVFPDDMPDDQIEAVIQKQFPNEGQGGNESQLPAVPDVSDQEELEPPEETGVFGAYHDLQDMLGTALDKGADFFDRAPENYDLIKQDISKNGLSGVAHQYGQGIAEIAELQKAAANSPHDFAKYLIKKHLTSGAKPLDIYSMVRDKIGDKVKLPEAPKDYADLIPSIPEDTGIEKKLGLEANPARGDELTRGLIDLGGIVEGGRGLFKLGKKVLKAPDLKQAIRDTQAKVNAADSRTGQVFDRIESEVGKRGIGKVTLDPGVIDSAEGLLTPSKANKLLIAKAKTGDYVALRKLQSDLRVKAEKALASDLKSENDIGELMDETRQDINQGIASHLKDTGHEDLAKALKQARNEYRDIKQTYFSNPALSKVFGESQVVPKNPMTLLTEESTEMNRFMARHPEVEKMLAKALKHKTVKKVAGIVLGGLGLGSAGGATYKYLGK